MAQLDVWIKRRPAPRLADRLLPFPCLPARATEEILPGTSVDPPFTETRPSAATHRQVASLHRTLRDVFALSEFRPGQLEVIEAVLSGRDAMAVMPTGAGKSLCYQIPALHLPGTTVVVSPLIALISDQTGKLGGLGLDASQIDSSPHRARARPGRSTTCGTTGSSSSSPPRAAERSRIPGGARGGSRSISWWWTRRTASRSGATISGPRICGLGAAAIEALGHPPVLALTATATARTKADIAERAGPARSAALVTQGTYRANLVYEVRALLAPMRGEAVGAGAARGEAGGPASCTPPPSGRRSSCGAALAELGASVELYHAAPVGAGPRARAAALHGRRRRA